MNNQQILDNAPSVATHYGSEGDYYRQPKDSGGYWGLHKNEWSRLSALLDEVRSLADINRIVELEEHADEMIAEAEKADKRIAELENKLIAPTDSGVEELDAICERFNSDETSNLIKLVSEVWNKALVTPYSTKRR